MKKLLTILFFFPAFLMAQLRPRMDLSNIALQSSGPNITLNPIFIQNITATAGTASPGQLVSFSGTNLSANIVVTAITGSSISKDSSTWVTTTLTYTLTGGAVSDHFFVRSNPASPSGHYTGNITVASTGATTKNLPADITISALSPTISSSPTIVDLGTTTVNNPGDPVNVTITGSNLSSGITMTAGAGSEISADNGSTFQSSITIPQSGGSAFMVVPVRLPSAGSPSNPSGNIVLTSPGATTVNVAYSGSITSGGGGGSPLGQDTIVMQLNLSQTTVTVADYLNWAINPNCATDSSITDNRFRNPVTATVIPSRWTGFGSTDGCGLHASSNTGGVSGSTIVPSNAALGLWWNAYLSGTFPGATYTDTNFVFSGLNPDSLYTFWFYAADGTSISCPGGRLITPHIYDSTNHRDDSVFEFNTKANISDSIYFKNKRPDASGKIRVAWYVKSGRNTSNCSQYAPINVIRVTQQGHRLGIEWWLLIGLLPAIFKRKKWASS